jgi:hypothetical protein
MPSAAAIKATRLTQAWKPFVKLSFDVSHSPGVARATGTVTTKPNEIKTNKAVKAVIINIFEKFLYRRSN